MTRITALRRENIESSLIHPFHHVRAELEGASFEPEGRLPPDSTSTGTMTLDIPASRTVRNRCLLLLSHLVYGIFVREAE